MFRYLSPNGKDFLVKQDRKWCYRVIFLMFIAVVSYLVYVRIRMESSDTFLDNPYTALEMKSITSKVVEHSIAMSILGVLVDGNVYSVMLFYTMIGFVFEAYSMKLSLVLKLLNSKTSSVTSEEIRGVRSQMDVYFILKERVERLSNIFPFFWMSFVMISITSYVSKGIREWEQSLGEVAFIFHILCTTKYLLSLYVVMKLRQNSDKKFNDSLEEAMCLTEKRESESSEVETRGDKMRKVLLNQELILLHNEVSNRISGTKSTISSMATFNQKTMVSFAGHIINFSVMIINIRVAFNSYSDPLTSTVKSMNVSANEVTPLP